MVEDCFLYNCLKTYEETVIYITEEFYELGNVGDAVNDNGFFTAVKGMLHSYVVGNGTSNGIIYYLSGIAFAIALAFFLINIIQLAMEEKLTPEFLVKNGAKLAVAVAGIMWAPTILTAIIGFGEAFGEMFADVKFDGSMLLADKDGNAVSITMEDAIGEYVKVMDDIYSLDEQGLLLAGFMSELAAGLKVLLDTGLLSLFAFLIIPIITICILFIQITRYIELYVRGTFLPIAIGLMTEEGWRGAGGRYIRKILSLASQNAAIFMTLNVMGTMISATIAKSMYETSAYFHTTEYLKQFPDEKIFQGIGMMKIMSDINGVAIEVIIMGCVLSFAGIGFMFKSLGVMDDLWGAR